MTTPEQLLIEAQREIGYTENPPGSNRQKYAALAGHANGQPWCASFIVAIARRVALKLPSESAYTPAMATGFRQAGRFGKEPKLGAVAFFDFPGDSKKRIQHVGYVESWNADTLVTIDGNTSSGPGGSEDNGGGVFRRRRNRAYVVGYGYPDYTPAPAPTPAPVPTDQEADLMIVTHVIDRAGVSPAGWAALDGSTFGQTTLHSSFVAAARSGSAKGKIRIAPPLGWQLTAEQEQVYARTVPFTMSRGTPVAVAAWAHGEWVVELDEGVIETEARTIPYRT